MARIARVVVPNYPHHVTQRGNRRQRVFFSSEDYQYYIQLMAKVGGGALRVSPVPTTAPSAHTVMGFSVDDVSSVVASLSERGVEFERFDGFLHDETGLHTSPDGSQVASDPD